MDIDAAGKATWTKLYNYHKTDSINCCELCSYSDPIDIDEKPGVEALYCMAGAEDTRKIFEVDFDGVCDLFLSDLLEEKQDD